MGLLNYSTKIEAAKTVGEIQQILAAHGAKSILTHYGADGSVEALAFQIETAQGVVSFRLPINPEPVLKILQRQSSSGKLRTWVPLNHAQAVRVAWRIIKDWVEAQMALLETEMVKMEEVFLPYVITRGGRTLYQAMVDRHFQLPEGREE